MRSLFDISRALQDEKEAAALCTVVAVKGSTPAKPGAKMAVLSTGKIFGTIGGGDLEKKVIENAFTVLKNNKPELFRHDLLHQHSMCCGGTVDIFIEPVVKKSRLYVFGAGHTGQALAKFAVDLDFDVFVIDNRKEYVDQISNPAINKMNLEFEQAVGLLPFDHSTYVAIMTYDHAIDRNILAYCIAKPHAYLGMIGSRRKVEMTKKMFSEGGLATFEELNKVDMPMGIDIQSETPAEIAVSVVARLIETRKKQVYAAK